MTRTIGYAVLGVGTLLAFTACGETSGSVLERIPEYQEVDAGGSSTPPGTDMDVDVFVVRDVESCAVGEPCRPNDPDTHGDENCFMLELDDGTRLGFRSESLDFVSRDDDRVRQAQQAQCFDLVFGDDERTKLADNLTELTNRVYEFSDGEILLDINVHEIASLTAEFEPFENEWGIFLPPKALEAHVRSLSRDTDFIFSVTGSRDPMAGITPQVDRCAGTVHDIERGLVGAPYTWLSDKCNGENALLRNWMIQVDVALSDVNGFNDAYDGQYPRCGEAQEDPTHWWPNPDECSVDPDAPTCRQDCEGTDDDYVRHVLTAHWPRSRSFVGNHCSNGRTDHGETDVDVGGACDAFDR